MVFLFVSKFDFCKGRIEDQLLVTYGKVVNLVDEGSVVNMLFLDISKAFDVVNHYYKYWALVLSFSFGFVNFYIVGQCELRLHVN